MKIKGLIRDLHALNMGVNKRKERINAASSKPLRSDPIRILARNLHPENITLKVSEITSISPKVKELKFELIEKQAINIPYFQAGQYLCLKVKDGNNLFMRPYSICSSFYDAATLDNKGKKKPSFISIAVENRGRIGSFLFNQLNIGDTLEASLPHGKFFYEPLRDENKIVAIASGTGVLPFLAMLKEMDIGQLNIELTLLYLNKDCIYVEEIAKLVELKKNKAKFEIMDGVENIKVKLKQFTSSNEYSFYICGGDNFYKSIFQELVDDKIPLRRIRKEIYGENINIYDCIDYPEQSKGKEFTITVLEGNKSIKVKAFSSETVLLCLESNGFKKSSHCRLGECGFCTSEVIEGDYFVDPLRDGRRKAEKEMNYFHPCSSYPTSDMTIKID